ncbi:hypothetical protein L484_013872 [Morus notabilis]|uniref:J domain-containing protein n=1 Tax=Morus notabilis TaxID=981085 RepID=W9QYF1_9ROSA|nr:hypothetical protein L484_013872 [Morus notabilis]
MKGDEAKLLLGFAPNSRPSPSQVKAAYKRKVWECHPDLFPARHKKPLAESNFKLNVELLLTCLFFVNYLFLLARAYKKQKEAYPSHNPFLP